MGVVPLGIFCGQVEHRAPLASLVDVLVCGLHPDKANIGSLWDSFAEVESGQCNVCGRSVDNPDSRLEAGHDEIACHTMDMVGPGGS